MNLPFNNPSDEFDNEPHDIVTPRRASSSDTTMVVVMELQHANFRGFVHGGEIMRLVDNCAAMAAAKYCKRRVVTVAMDSMSFLVPVNLGELLTVKAMVNGVHKTSMEVGVRVEVENVRTEEIRHVSSAYLVFVAVDDTGRPVPVPPLEAVTEEEKRRKRKSEIRREQRLANKKAIDAAGKEA